VIRRLAASPSFAALHHRNFRLLWLGQLVSFSGTMMQSAAVLWHVALLAPPDQKGWALGLVGLVRFVPIVLFSMLSGVVADAHDRRRLMLITQSLMALSALVLATLAFGGLSTAWPLYALTAFGAAAGAFDGPARQSLIPQLVPREVLPNAISLNTIMFQVAAVFGPTVAGLLIATAGLPWVYALNALSFVAVIVALVAMRDVPEPAAGERSDVSFKAALEGLRFTFSQPLIRSTMLLDFMATFFSSATALLPIFAQDILKVGARGYGWLYAAPSVGAMLAGVVMVRVADRIERRGRVLLAAVAVYGLFTVLFGLSRSFALTFLCLAVTGAADTVSMVLRNVVRHLATPDAMRGRMTGVNMVFFMGGPQLGELEAGLVAQAWSAPWSVITGGIGCLVATAWTAWRTPELRAYRRADSVGVVVPAPARGAVALGERSASAGRDAAE
jgi:MFS family permease